MTDNSFIKSLEILQIEDFAERIINSNSHGELFHIADYIRLARIVKEKPSIATDVEVTIRAAVAYAEKNWKRPESVFQHIRAIF